MGRRRRYPIVVEDAILDAIRELGEETGKPTFHWKQIRRKIYERTGVWVMDTTLVRALRRLREEGVLYGKDGRWGFKW